MPITPIGKVLISNQVNNYIIETRQEPKEVPVKSLEGRPFSASAVSMFAECPYMFYYKYVLEAEQPEDIDIYEVIPANEYGTMAHDLLEHLDKSQTTLNDFLIECDKRFNEYLVLNPSDNEALSKKCHDNFLKMMQNAFEMEGNEQTAFREKDIYYKDPKTGITIHGFPDKVIKNTDDSYRIVDYKTGYKIKHDVEVKWSMIQCTQYAYILEKSRRVKVSSFEYRYLRNKAHVYSTDKGFTMDQHYRVLEETLEDLKAALETGKFNDTQDKEICHNCNFKSMCPKNKD